MIHDGDTKCPQLKPKNKFIITGGPIGFLDFSGEPNGGPVPCTKLYLLWILMPVVCASYILSAASVGVIRSKEKKPEKALWCARAMGDPFAGRDRHHEPSPSEISSVARLEEVVFARPWQQIRPRPVVHVSTRSLDSVETAEDNDGRGGRYYCRDELYTNWSGPRASRYDCTPRVDGSIGLEGAGASQGRSLGNQVLQGGKSEVDNYNNRS